MPKRKDFDFGTFMDMESLNELAEKGSKVAPSKEEIKIVKNSDGDMRNIPVSKLSEYHTHTYKVLDNEDMEALCDSIKDIGIILPLLVREKGLDEFEVVSGHRRLFAAKKIKLKEVPCKILTVDDATADIMMVDTNLHREEILPSDKARSYELRIEAMKTKGLLDKTSESESKYEELLAIDVKSSKVNVYRYRKLLNLCDELLNLVDKKVIAVNAGAKLAAVPMNQQMHIVDALKETRRPITMDAADKIATASRTGLTKDKVLEILDGSFKPRKKKVQVSPKAIKEKNIKTSYPKSVATLSGAEKESFIKDCIEEYIKNHKEWNGHEL